LPTPEITLKSPKKGFQDYEERRVNMEREEQIRMIAYSLWVQDGYCRGAAVRHWLEAEEIWEKQHHKPISEWVSKQDAERAVNPDATIYIK
jgi:hypothetical protein